MKTTALLLIGLTFATASLAQDRPGIDVYCTYFGTPFEEAVYTFPADREAETTVDRLLGVVRLPQNFTVRAANVPDVSAARAGGRRLLLYNQFFMRKAGTETDEGWAALRVLAHEIGHHLLNHTLGTEAARTLEELEADDFSGYVLARLRASKRQVVAGMDTLAALPERPTHPALPLRLSALREGWDKAGGTTEHYFGYDASGETSGGPGGSDPDAPSFPWPPPKASAFTDVGLGLLTRDAPAPTFRTLADRLEAALAAAGYGERSYYAVPGGFALVARLEQIEADGTPKPVPDRWSMTVRNMPRFSLTEYFKALFKGTPGRYRIVVFVVSAIPFSQMNEEVTVTESRAWLTGGLNALPASIGARPRTDDVRCTALIYEFERPSSGAPVRFRDPSPLTGSTHLEKARLWAALRE